MRHTISRARTRIVTGVAAAILGLSAAQLASGPAGATAPSTPASITAWVLNSSSPRASFDALGPDDRATFLAGFANQTAVTVADSGGSYAPTAAQLAAMTTGAAPSELTAAAAATTASGCWYRYWYRSWSDFGIHDGDSWLQLNWCGSGGRITRWSQSNYGCAGHAGAGCSTGVRADMNVGWEVRSTRYFNASIFGFGNTFCMQIRGGATGLYSENSSASNGCPLS